jgi:AraC-like DNA-binding protein
VIPGLLMTCAIVVRDPLFASLLEGMAAERTANRIGSSSVVTRLANVVTAAAIRAWVESGCGSAECLIIAVNDPDVLRAIAAIHRDPGSAWTVDALARVALTSRSAFAERFRATVSDSPARYLVKVRMERAKELLVHDELSVTETASVLGYGSDAAFSRAFRRFTGLSPSSWRRSIEDTDMSFDAASARSA